MSDNAALREETVGIAARAGSGGVGERGGRLIVRIGADERGE